MWFYHVISQLQVQLPSFPYLSVIPMGIPWVQVVVVQVTAHPHVLQGIGRDHLSRFAFANLFQLIQDAATRLPWDHGPGFGGHFDVFDTTIG